MPLSVYGALLGGCSARQRLEVLAGGRSPGAAEADRAASERGRQVRVGIARVLAQGSQPVKQKQIFMGLAAGETSALLSLSGESSSYLLICNSIGGK